MDKVSSQILALLTRQPRPPLGLWLHKYIFCVGSCRRHWDRLSERERSLIQSLERWRQAAADARRFIAKWGEQAGRRLSGSGLLMSR